MRKLWGKDKQIDVALVMCPAWGVNQPPISICSLKSYLSKHDIKSKCLDFNVEFYRKFPNKKYWNLNYPEYFIIPELFEKEIAPLSRKFIKAWAKKIVKMRPLAIGISLFMSNRNMSMLLAQQIKTIQPDIKIIAGGPQTVCFKRQCERYCSQVAKGEALDKDIIEMMNSFDIIVCNEGEETLLEIISKLKEQQDISGIEGTIILKGNEIQINEPRTLIEDINCLEPPDFSDLPYDLFGSFYQHDVLPVVSSRGCVNSCTFCSDSPLWKRYRYRSAEKVVEELKALIKKYKCPRVEFVDSVFNGNPQRLREICDLMISSQVDIEWSAKLRIEQGLTLDMVKKMHQAGCSSVSYGIESGSARVLKDMRKNINLSDARQIIRDTAQAGIKAYCFFIIGYPTETEEDFQLTLDFIKENAAYISRFDQVTACHIDKESYLGRNKDKHGISFEKDGWHSKYSTPEIRRERLARFQELAYQLHSDYECEVQQ